MTKQKSLLKPSIEIAVAAILWGFGFVATVWALPFLSPSAIISYRFLTAFAVGMAVLPFMKVSRHTLFYEFKLSIVAGVLLGLCLFLQTWGLQFTSATNSGFITTLYVVFVPFVARLCLREKLSLIHWLCVTLALIGTAMIVRLGSLDLNKGDLLTLLCALAASLQIVYIGWISNKSKESFVFNALQSFWAGAPFLLLIPFEAPQGKWDLTSMSALGWAGLLSLTIGSTIIGFYLQVRAQKEVSPSHASLLYLLESPFSCFFAILLLNESITLIQISGAILIIASCALATVFESKELKI